MNQYAVQVHSLAKQIMDSGIKIYFDDAIYNYSGQKIWRISFASEGVRYVCCSSLAEVASWILLLVNIKIDNNQIENVVDLMCGNLKTHTLLFLEGLKLPLDCSIDHVLYNKCLRNVDKLFYFERRTTFNKEFSWAVPSMPILQEIAKYGPIVEVGAGKGLWAYLLKLMGVDIIATDIEVTTSLELKENSWYDGLPFTEIEKITSEEAAKKYADRALFICWPEHGKSDAYYAVVEYINNGGKTVIYIGEDEEGGCNAEENFFKVLFNYFDNVVPFELGDKQHKKFSGIYDYLGIYKLIS